MNLRSSEASTSGKVMMMILHKHLLQESEARQLRMTENLLLIVMTLT